MTQMLIVADGTRSVSFYRDVLGATVLREHSPAMLKFHNGWLVINSGTADRRQASPPDSARGPNRVSTLMDSASATLRPHRSGLQAALGHVSGPSTREPASSIRSSHDATTA